MDVGINKVVLIGNGFDLAHGFPTSYNQFMLDYLKKRLIANWGTQRGNNEEDIFKFHFEKKFSDVAQKDLDNYHNLQTLLTNLKRANISIYGEIDFANSLLGACSRQWVDIEEIYYRELLKISLILNEDEQSKQLTKLNQALLTIKKALIEYLSSLQLNVDNHSRPFLEICQFIEQPLNNNSFSKHFNINIAKNVRTANEIENIMLVNFNYTTTPQFYQDALENVNSLNIRSTNIHGKLSLQDAIFGYGDDFSEEYKKLENANIESLLVNMKTSWYSKTSRYHELINFINSQPYHVLIMGHSCGLSDRTLLNSIFENDNCMDIEILFHEKEPGNDDHFSKSLNISRHFSDKQKFRYRIIPRDKSFKMPQFI
ncbi:AbiH family protein [Altibacter sp.]|uniref:AbiH family protein n=1 Tax=Altibacter sp. TaxID=2024823 RepID=UPI000C8B2691|nr:AbiH family protein [Altibacter sp.]MAP54610.1 hypothetical protein [Altibacter sp.]